MNSLLLILLMSTFNKPLTFSIFPTVFFENRICHFLKTSLNSRDVLFRYIPIQKPFHNREYCIKNIWHHYNRHQSNPVAAFWILIGKIRSSQEILLDMSPRSYPPRVHRRSRPVRCDGYSDKNNSCGMGRTGSSLPSYPGPRHPGCMYSKRIWSTSSRSTDSD